MSSDLLCCSVSSNRKLKSVVFWHLVVILVSVCKNLSLCSRSRHSSFPAPFFPGSLSPKELPVGGSPANEILLYLFQSWNWDQLLRKKIAFSWTSVTNTYVLNIHPLMLGSVFIHCISSVWLVLTQLSLDSSPGLHRRKTKPKKMKNLSNLLKKKANSIAAIFI